MYVIKGHWFGEEEADEDEEKVINETTKKEVLLLPCKLCYLCSCDY